MKKIAFSSLLLSLFIYSCSGTFQYCVNVKNDTEEQITIRYQSYKDIQGNVEKTLVLQPGELKQIICTIDIDPEDNSPKTSPTHCRLVAEYVDAFIRDSILSTLKWCDEGVAFSRTDIEQAEFTINYTMEDFVGAE